MKKILLHTCCAPCATYAHRWLAENGFDPSAYYYNPNIFPEGEFVKRYFVLKSYSRVSKLPLIFEFDKEKTIPGDCRSCYDKRLRKTAEYAKRNKFECFSTTLLISPYQNHEIIKEIGEEVGEGIGIKFFYHDFREGYQESRKISRELALYRQKYCGCKEKKRDQVASLVA